MVVAVGNIFVCSSSPFAKLLSIVSYVSIGHEQTTSNICVLIIISMSEEFFFCDNIANFNFKR